MTDILQGNDAERYRRMLDIPEGDLAGRTCLLRAKTSFGTDETFAATIKDYYKSPASGVEEVVLEIEPQQHRDRTTGISATFNKLTRNVAPVTRSKSQWLANVSYENLLKSESGKPQYLSPFWEIGELRFN